MSKKSRKVFKKALALMLAFIMAVPAVDGSLFMTVNAAAEISVTKSGGYEEGAYAEWSEVEGAGGYQVYVSKTEGTWPDTPIDDELIRKYPDHYRADILGLSAGKWHIRVVAGTFDADKKLIDTVAEKVISVDVTAHDRSGYAWEGYDAAANDNENTPGAYKKDGTLKDDARVIYITNTNKDTVSLDVNGTSRAGLQNILNGYKEGKETKPLDVRIIGNIEDFAYMDKGDIAIENGKKAAAGITIEGIGEDAVANGWGIGIENAVNVEVRNLAFMNCNSTEGDNVRLQQNNTHIWVHDNDFFYGNAGSDADQKKGDGMLDCKNSDLITFSYNHFWDSGKSCLLGLEEGVNNPDFVGRITYHHNWFDHSDSRHPRIRYFTTHIYNNYYDGVAKYGVGAAAGGTSVFVESNYFKNTKFPMLISQQGSDLSESDGKFEAVDKSGYEDGSMIKAYGNYMDEYSSKYFIPYKAPAKQAAIQQEADLAEEGFVPYVALEQEPETIVSEEAENKGIIAEEDKNNDDSEMTAHSDNSESTENNGINKNSENDDDIENNVNDGDNSVNAEEQQYGNTEAVDAEDVGNTDNSVEDGSIEYDENTEETENENIVSEGEEKNDSDDKAEADYAQSADFTNDASVDFDAYVVENRDDKVPDTVKTKKGAHTYNNFDTAEDFYKYTADPAENVPVIVKERAGRVNGGDLQFTFTEADDRSSDINEALKALCTNYKSKIVSIGGINETDTTVYYTVTFDPNNGEDSFTEKVEANTAIKEPAQPSKMPEGKVGFDGWYKGSRKWNFEDAVTGDMTLEGKWLAEGEEPGSYGAKPIGTEKVIHDFTKDGMDSPYFDITGTLDKQRGTSVSYNGLQYTSGNGKGRLNMSDATSAVSFTTTTDAAVVLFLRPDKIDKKTNIDDKSYVQVKGLIITRIGAGEHKITKNQDNYLYAVMVVPLDASKQFTVTVNKDDGSSPLEIKVNQGDSVTKEKLPDPVKEGYEFGGWKNSYGEDVTLPYMPLINITLHAVWKQNGEEVHPATHTITFNTNGAGDIAPQIVENGQKCAKPDPEPVKEGYTFDGWYTDSECTKAYDFETPVTEDITLYAKWTEDAGEDPGYTPKEGLSIEFKNENEVYTYTGSRINPEIIVRNNLNGRELVEGVDYTVKYTNNINAAQKDSRKAPSITITGKGIYAGKTAPKTFTIEKKNIKDGDIKAVKVIAVKDKAVKLPVLYYGGIKLTSKDIKFKENKIYNKVTEPGSYEQLVLEGNGNNYTGELSVDVQVVADNKAAKAAVKKFKVTVDSNIRNIVYTGGDLCEQLRDCITVHDKTTDAELENSAENTFYEIVFPKNTMDAGTVKFTVVGLGDYSGCNIVKSCKIAPTAVSESNMVSVDDIDGYDAAGKAGKMLIQGMTKGGKDINPQYMSTGALFNELRLAWVSNAVDEKGDPVVLPLTEGKDYKLSYSGNKKAGSAAKFTITFKGNYKGKFVKNFTIDKAELSIDTVDEIGGAYVLLPDKVAGKKGVYKSTPYISINNVLVKNSECDIRYYTDEAMTADTEMSKDNPIDFGAGEAYKTVYVKIKAKASSKNYVNPADESKCITGSYKVWNKNAASNKVDLTKAKVVFYKDEAGKVKTTKLEYTGGKIEPAVLKVMNKSAEVANKDDANYEYKVINNVNKGKATVIVYAKEGGNCIGARVATFSIVPCRLNNYLQ